MAIKLYELGLLPETNRKELTSTIKDYTIQGLDFYYLDDEDVRSLFTDDEKKILDRKIEIEVIPGISAIIYQWQSEINKNDSIENQMEPLVDALGVMKDKFNGDSEFINKEIDSLKVWIEENEPAEKGRHLRQKLQSIDEEEKDQDNRERSIFDDIDI